MESLMSLSKQNTPSFTELQDAENKFPRAKILVYTNAKRGLNLDMKLT